MDRKKGSEITFPKNFKIPKARPSKRFMMENIEPTPKQSKIWWIGKSIDQKTLTKSRKAQKIIQQIPHNFSLNFWYNKNLFKFFRQQFSMSIFDPRKLWLNTSKDKSSSKHFRPIFFFVSSQKILKLSFLKCLFSSSFLKIIFCLL